MRENRRPDGLVHQCTAVPVSSATLDMSPVNGSDILNSMDDAAPNYSGVHGPD